MARGSQTRRLGALAVLASGGVESAAMLSEALQRYERVYPIYIRKGLQWESAEVAALRKLLDTLKQDGLAKLTLLSVPIRPLYGPHWGLGRARTPSSKAPDAAVYLPGRNLLLLSLAGLFCSLRKIPNLWLGTLKNNPFHDARAGFIREIEALLGQATGFPLRIATPFRELTKGQVISRWPRVAWGLTFSCLKPAGRRHCGRCQKCGERRAGFRAAGIPDPTKYAC